jgi:prepilin-type N-terminal cleavage/methylation domain-containing protein
MRKGFTLIELLIVVIVIAILATFAIPQYMKAVERAKVSKAAHHLGLISQAEKMYRADLDEYPDVSDGDFGTTFEDYVELNEIDNDMDWSYSVTGSGDGSTFTATADRSAGPYAGQALEVNEMGEWDGSDHGLFRIPGSE